MTGEGVRGAGPCGALHPATERDPIATATTRAPAGWSAPAEADCFG